MKRLYMIGGPMGVGKTAACRQLQQLLDRSVFLDGDWCWDAHPFQVTEETREMVLENISFLLNSFLRCSAYDHVIFCWVLHRREIREDLLRRLTEPYALRATSIASAVVLVDTEVFFVAAASALFLGQRLPRRTWPAVLLAFAGSAVVALADSAAGTNALLGDLIALAGAAAMAVYTMIGTVCRQRLSTSVYTFLVYTSAAATLLAAALLSGTPLAGYGPVNGLTALGMAVCCTLLGHNVFSWGLKYLPPAFIATVKLMEPVFASVWGLLLFGERPGWLTVAGGAAVLLGVGLYARTIGGDAGKREEREP